MGSPLNKTIAISCALANEEKTIENFIFDVFENTKEFRDVFFIGVFDQACKDNTREIALDLAEKDSRILIKSLPDGRVPTDAYLHGFETALSLNSDLIFDMNAGYRHLPSEMDRFFEHIGKFDCVFGSRFTNGGSMSAPSFKRRLYSSGGTLIANALYGTSLTDMTSGFQLFQRNVIEFLMSNRPKSKYHFLQTEIKVLCKKFTVKEVPITYKTHAPGLKSKVFVDAAINMLRLSATHNRFRFQRQV